MNHDMPCRVMSDLAEHEASLRDGYPTAFDETDENHVRAVVPYELAESVQHLLQWRDAASLPEEMRRDIDRLYRACVSRWRDI